MSVVTPQPVEAPALLTTRPRRSRRPPEAELSSIRGVLVGLVLAFPFWMAVAARLSG